MSRLLRLQKAFRRHGIRVEREGATYRLRSASSHAQILLPDGLPLEEKAVLQLMALADVRSAGGDAGVCRTCATPDFHPGALAPVGTIVATPRDFVIPHAIGTDIACGMRLLATPIAFARAAPHADALTRRLTRLFLEGGRDVPVPGRAFAALFDVGPAAFVDALAPEGLWAEVDRGRIVDELGRCIGLASFGGHSRHAPEALLARDRPLLRDPQFATPGGGNHFVEFQVVDRVLDRHAAYAAGLREGCIAVMVHSGSRDTGFFVGNRWMDKARDAWPAGVAHPASGLYGLRGPLASEYLDAMGVAARYAWANRMALGELARQALREALAEDGARLVVDVPHNVILTEGEYNVHRKGATPAHAGALALVPGSMGDYSYLVTGLGNPDWLSSCSHGAGRAVRRQQVRADRATRAQHAGLPWRCVTLREERRIEEAPHAYKPVGPVIDTQVDEGLITPAVRLRPWLTVKA